MLSPVSNILTGGLKIIIHRYLQKSNMTVFRICVPLFPEKGGKKLPNGAVDSLFNFLM
jgi:hypothetical protein